MRRVRVVVTLALGAWLTVAASGCGCTCSPPRYYPPSPTPYLGSTSSDARTPAERAPSYYDRYREERHRREVEKQLRDIKRNTQRAKPLR